MTEATDADEIVTGIETNSAIESGIDDTHDVYYYIDDGEFAYVVGSTDITDDADADDVVVKDDHRLHRIKHYVCEAGLVDEFSAPTVHEVPDGRIDQYLTEYVREVGTQAEAIDAAKEHFA
jgi:hypothetical protein